MAADEECGACLFNSRGSTGGAVAAFASGDTQPNQQGVPAVTRTLARTPLWFGPEDKPVFGWLHTPADGRVRGGVVLCPSLGAELVSSHPALRELAEELADAGFAALRIDYPGTGDSAGELVDGADVKALSPAIATAVTLLRDSGCSWVAAVGLRIGATLLAGGLPGGATLDAAVLWDPCDGSRFLHEQSVRYRLTTGQEHSGDDVHSVGFVYSAPVAAALSRITLDDGDGLRGVPALALLRPTRTRRAVQEFLSASGAQVAEATEQVELLEVPTVERRLPSATIAAIGNWLAALAPQQLTEVRLTGVRDTARIGRVTERFVTLGPLGLFGVRTDPVGSAVGPVAILLNVAAEHHIGPGRLWVELARRWAGEGTSVVRLDLAGLGDSPSRPGAGRDQVYDPDHLDDLADIAAVLRAQGANGLMPMGLCSGAYHALEWAIHSGADSVVAINPVLGLLLPEAIDGRADPRRAAAHSPRPLFRRLGAAKGLSALKHRLPAFVWQALDRLGLHPVPTTGLERAVDKGVDTLMVASTFDAATYQRRSAKTLRRLEQTGRFRLSVVVDIDHSLQIERARQRVAAELTAFVASRRVASGGPHLVASSSDPAAG